MPNPPPGPTHDTAPQPMSVKLATSGIGERLLIEAVVAARAVAAVVLDALEVRGVEAGARARRELHRVVADQVLDAADEAFRHVEHVVGRLERDEVIAVEPAAEELVRVVEAGRASGDTRCACPSRSPRR